MLRFFYSQFTGGGGADVGAVAAGLIPVGGVEYRPDIAYVYEANFGHPLTIAPVQDVDYAEVAARLPGPVCHHHASPSCKNASVVNANAGETDEDIAAALGVIRALEAFRPVVFTLENVRAYAKFDAYARIVAALRRLGYGMRAAILNAADYGVPQTRERLILRAVRGADDWCVALPTPTHQETPPPEAQMGLWDVPALPRWVGWYAAIADLVDTLPASEFAPWQLARLPESIAGSVLVEGNTPTVRAPLVAIADEPRWTVRAAEGKGMPRAFIVSNAKTEYSDGLRDGDEPMLSVTTQMAGRVRAWLVDGDGNRSREPTLLTGDDPAMTVQAWHGRRPSSSPRAWLAAGRVVKMTPRALARFQSFPDTYRLPDKPALACEIVGNAVPPLLFQRIAELEAA